MGTINIALEIFNNPSFTIVERIKTLCLTSKTSTENMQSHFKAFSVHLKFSLALFPSQPFA